MTHVIQALQHVNIINETEGLTVISTLGNVAVYSGDDNASGSRHKEQCTIIWAGCAETDGCPECLTLTQSARPAPWKQTWRRRHRLLPASLPGENEIRVLSRRFTSKPWRDWR